MTVLLGIVLNVDDQIGREHKKKGGQEGRISTDMTCVYTWFPDDSG